MSHVRNGLQRSILARRVIRPLAWLYARTVGHPKIVYLFEAVRSQFRLAYLNDYGDSCSLGKGSHVINGECISIGHRVRIGRYARLETIKEYRGVRHSPKLRIEDGVNIGWNSHLACAHEVTIGRDTLIASGVYISDHNHGYSTPAVHGHRPADTPLEVSFVHIGQRCWIGEQVCILPGVRVGDDSIVGAGSVVTRDVPPGSIVVGAPARVIRQRDEDGRWKALGSPIGEQ